MKNKKGITLVALIITIIVMLILVNVSVQIVIKSDLIGTAEEVANLYKITYSQEQDLMNKIKIGDETFEDFIEQYDGKVNSPKLGKGMTPIAWDEEGNPFIPKTNEEWYNYVDQEEGVDGTSKWANAVTEDGSYWVWIPRFAYKITSTTTDSTKAGTIDIVFLEGTSNRGIDNVIYDMPKEDVDTTAKYIVHPAFCGTGYEELGGGFGNSAEGITGFWVAKYEMSMEGKTDEGEWTTLTPISRTSTTGVSGNIGTTNTITAYNATVEEGKKLSTSVTDGTTTYTNIRAVSKPGVSSWRYMNISNCYENAYNYNRSLDSHLMKNSEWGAVAYLTHSSYGRNGKEVDINGSGFVSAAGGEGTSSTGNKTGIYDLSGAAYESVAAFNDAYPSTGKYYLKTNTSYYSSTGKNMGITGLENKGSTKYLTAYRNNTNTSYQDFTVGKVSVVGDGIKEINVTEYYGWYDDYTSFAYSSIPFFGRGGDYNLTSNAGVFCTVSNGGVSNNSISFRVTCSF